MATYYRWIARGPDLKSAQQKILAVSASPRHACWIFDMTKYTPSSGVHADRVLVAISFDATGEAIINDQSRWIRFPGTAFKGEAQHPDGIILKTNEPGAYGLGQSVLKEINKGIKEVRLAIRQELAGGARQAHTAVAGGRAHEAPEVVRPARPAKLVACPSSRSRVKPPVLLPFKHIPGHDRTAQR